MAFLELLTRLLKILYALVTGIVLDDDKLIITVTFRDEPIIIMTSEEAAEVARLGSNINSLAPPDIGKGIRKDAFFLFYSSYLLESAVFAKDYEL